MDHTDDCRREEIRVLRCHESFNTVNQPTTNTRFLNWNRLDYVKIVTCGLVRELDSVSRVINTDTLSLTLIPVNLIVLKCAVNADSIITRMRLNNENDK